MFGPHWTAELSGVDANLILDKDYIDTFMHKVVEVANMQVIAGPLTIYYNHPIKPKECGVSSILILADSHCSLHSFINDGWIFLDLFTCAEMDRYKIDQLVLDTFSPKKYYSDIVWRGQEYQR